MTVDKNLYAIIIVDSIIPNPIELNNFHPPLQFKDVLGAGETTLQRTFNMVAKTVDVRNILLISKKKHIRYINNQLPNIKNDHILECPVKANYQALLLVASLKVVKLNSNAKILVLDAQHWIENKKGFYNNVYAAKEICDQINYKSRLLITAGVTPKFPNSNYNYFCLTNKTRPLQNVSEIVVRPNYQNAKKIVHKGTALWGTNIIITKAKALIEHFQVFEAEMYNNLISGYDLFNTIEEIKFIEENCSEEYQCKGLDNLFLKSDYLKIFKASFVWEKLETLPYHYGTKQFYNS